MKLKVRITVVAFLTAFTLTFSNAKDIIIIRTVTITTVRMNFNNIHIFRVAIFRK